MAHRLLWAEKACSWLESFEEGLPHPSGVYLTLKRQTSFIMVMLRTADGRPPNNTSPRLIHLQDQCMSKTSTSPTDTARLYDSSHQLHMQGMGDLMCSLQ